jgi:hypothetical protein
MIHEALFSRLSGYAGLTALVGARIYPRLLPQNPTYPAVTYDRISAERQSAMGSDSGLVSGRWQVSSWGKTYTDARDIAEQVRKALQRYRGTSSGTVIQDIFIESENDLPPELVDGEAVFQIASDFIVWFVES